jgi:thiol-disulfide isomerase/thioredoxin
MNAFKTITLISGLLLCSGMSFGQTNKTTTHRTQFSVSLNENTVILDSANKRISYPNVLKMVATGAYTLDPLRDKGGNATGEFRVRLKKTDDAGKREVKLESAGNEYWQKPNVGDTVPAFTMAAMNDSIINSMQLRGKIVVISFWFSVCKPCLYEMPEINELAAGYKGNDNVVFLAPDWETKEVIKKFMEVQPFSYIAIPEAHPLIDAMKIHIYPTHLVIGRDGKF